jgi:hypothetical protein
LQALGIGLYALFPNPIDTRGPMALLRTIVTFAYVLPAVFIGALAGSFGGGVVAFITMCAILTAEGLLAIEFASYRFREAGAAMALVSVGAA